MNIKRAKKEIRDTVQAYLMKGEDGEYLIPPIRQRPILLLGAPGIGKTQIMEQIARECGICLAAYTITHHTRQSAIGLPFISKRTFGGKEYTVTEYTMSEIVASLYEKMEQTGLKEGILFLDEINCVSETLAPAMLQFLQCKTFGNHKIPEGWLIVAAGNPPEYNKSVREFDVVTLDRVKKILVEPDFAVWKEYAKEQRLHPAVVSYLTARPGCFYHMETTVDGKNFVTPRGWEDLSQLLQVYERLGKKADREVTVQYLQQDRIARDFANYLALYEKYQMDRQLEEALEYGKISEDMVKKASHASFDEKAAVVSLVQSRCSASFAEAVRQEKVLEKVYGILKEGHRELTEKGTIPEAWISGKLDEAGKEYYKKKKAELLDRQGERLFRETLRILEQYAGALKKEAPDSGEKAYQMLKKWFSEEQDRQDLQWEKCGQTLEYAFDFMEAVFGSGQEMVLFLTELNSDPCSVFFLQQYECQRYDRYNKELLLDERRRTLEAKLKTYRSGDSYGRSRE